MDAHTLNAWTRFALQKGGIGTCTALIDNPATEPEDLMFMAGEKIIVLRRLDHDSPDANQRPTSSTSARRKSDALSDSEAWFLVSRYSSRPAPFCSCHFFPTLVFPMARSILPLSHFAAAISTDGRTLSFLSTSALAVMNLMLTPYLFLCFPSLPFPLLNSQFRLFQLAILLRLHLHHCTTASLAPFFFACNIISLVSPLHAIVPLPFQSTSITVTRPLSSTGLLRRCRRSLQGRSRPDPRPSEEARLDASQRCW